MPQRDARGRFVAQANPATEETTNDAGEFDALNTAAGLPLTTEWKYFPSRAPRSLGPWRAGSVGLEAPWVPGPRD